MKVSPADRCPEVGLLLEKNNMYTVSFLN
jgi:hypothetical protein